ncbi:Succinate dehydrogenase assembly factor 1, mitochondrial [Fulvia fulva]|uniref:Succinate dehydrogenase assembly factor 1, mitochondrial n=1 Tax=Passalora fulva TaxID=5499 RepID=A0A9Q8L7Z8_PASFU|nr:Succinate dehydrogenase assembly factor 1, mitochondrial [Fulvia fulva]KAK4636318.1 Succinate dehydrogenase assembly factor 1, mitochondrial [Fulvia fulva]KAK4637421.1 Succinate dehydrogenase assembly factor 1, mitochondrial [Fulvia fulva]UJO12477.1 Succinate dehydrogenase assembly factor 1, mitochondrial [Fulvia fulva]WPV08565.1 Succinate dehydrogenase assembly factor 1, mitochondrial [Fulvia fulva]WPV24574.1 Succinate dehydrogenase assembly factor 1, mitochondrial [Fulvia fulva]
MARAARLSGLQRDVLSLYRKCLRAARTKPAENRPNFYAFARHEFERNIGMDKKDFSTIEFLLRKGMRQLEIYEAPNITNIAG